MDRRMTGKWGNQESLLMSFHLKWGKNKWVTSLTWAAFPNMQTSMQKYEYTSCLGLGKKGNHLKIIKGKCIWFLFPPVNCYSLHSIKLYLTMIYD